MPRERVRVLYLHGFEEQSSSPKPAALAADARIELHVPRLDIWLTRRNSPLLSALVVAAPGLLGFFAVGQYRLDVNRKCPGQRAGERDRRRDRRENL